MLSFLKYTQNPAAEWVQQSKVQHGNLSNFKLLLVEHIHTNKLASATWWQKQIKSQLSKLMYAPHWLPLAIANKAQRNLSHYSKAEWNLGMPCGGHRW